MRIVIDMQGAQTESRFRGIGRYTLSLGLALARQRGEHEIILALSGQFPESIEPIRVAFDGLLAQENIRVWDAPAPTREVHPDNRLRREAAERIREAFLLAQEPDVVVVGSLFEGYGDDAVTSIGQFDRQTPTAVILYDLIPLLNPDQHFLSNKLQQSYYRRKIESLRNSKLLLAISASARQEALTGIGFDPEAVVNISGAYDDTFRVVDVSDVEKSRLLQKLGISRPFVFYTGGADDRKNLHRLIEAYGGLPRDVRSKHQLVLAGKMPQNHIDAFLRTAARNGLDKGELLLPGYIEDLDLLRLYNLCALFVFPSLHEGFGIPPLEAMACGAPVIGANATSLPEVIGLPEALFEPSSVESIRVKMAQALTDDAFRERLKAHGLSHVKTFTWDDSAKAALTALARFARPPQAAQASQVVFERTALFQPDRKRILILKLDHLGDFILALPALSKLKARYPFAQIDIAVGSWSVPLAQSLNLFSNVFAFDYFKKKSSESASTSARAIEDFVNSLGKPYDFAIDLRRQPDTRFILTKVPAALKIGYKTLDRNIDPLIDIGLSAHPDSAFEATVLNQTPISIQMSRLVDALPHHANDYVDCPALGPSIKPTGTQIAVFPRAGNDVKEWSRENYIALIERLVGRKDVDAVNVYFANSREAEEYNLPAHPGIRVHAGMALPSLIESLSGNVVCIANNSFGVHISGYLGLLVIGIYGGHETVEEWAPPFGNSYVISHPVACSPCHIAHRSQCPYSLKCLTEIGVDTVYGKVAEGLTRIAESRQKGAGTSILELSEQRVAKTLVRDLIQSLADLDLSGLSAGEKLELAQALATNHAGSEHRQIFVDISELVQRDARSGIQRVVRSVLRVMLDSPPPGFDIVPVYAVMGRQGYLKASRFCQAFIGNTAEHQVTDEPIIYRAGDYFLGLDLHPHLVVEQREALARMRARGVTVKFVVFDLLCATMPQHFVAGSKEPFIDWLRVVAGSDGAICISRSVADELKVWLRDQGLEFPRRFGVHDFRLGADIKGSVPSAGMTDEESRLLENLRNQTNFLMVGTLEPRKGHMQALKAFDRLWQAGSEVNLVIVGKKGWLVDALVRDIQQHRLLNKRLFWLQGVSDEFLERIYGVSSCLVVPSEGEGFGLPLIEAANHKLPVIARDLPVFREVAGEHAFYFSGTDPSALASTIETWMGLHQRGEHPTSHGMQAVTWQQSTQQLLDALLSNDE